jgi:hypothetical protein
MPIVRRFFLPSDQGIAGSMLREEGEKSDNKRYERMRFINLNSFLESQIVLTFFAHFLRNFCLLRKIRRFAENS